MNLEANASTAIKVAGQVSALGVKIPPDLAAAVDVYGAARNYEVAPVDVQAEAVELKAADVADLIERAADAAQRAEAVRPVRADLISALSRRVVRTTIASAKGFIAALARPFADAAQAFTELHAQLPADYDNSERLVAAGADAVAIYQQAHAAIATLDALRAVRDDLVGLGVVAPGGVLELGTRYAAVRNTGSAQRAAAALKAPNPLGVWGSLLSTEGVSRLHWLSLDDHQRYLASLPQQEDHYEVVDANGFRGHKLVQA